MANLRRGVLFEVLVGICKKYLQKIHETHKLSASIKFHFKKSRYERYVFELVFGDIWDQNENTSQIVQKILSIIYFLETIIMYLFLSYSILWFLMLSNLYHAVNSCCYPCYIFKLILFYDASLLEPMFLCSCSLGKWQLYLYRGR